MAAEWNILTEMDLEQPKQYIEVTLVSNDKKIKINCEDILRITFRKIDDYHYVETQNNIIYQFKETPEELLAQIEKNNELQSQTNYIPILNKYNLNPRI